MRICVIVNKNAGSADQAERFRQGVDEIESITCWTSHEQGEGIRLAAKAAGEEFDLVAAAGGDGTINEVVNGLMQSKRRPALGVIPLGTGNDFARMLDVPMRDPRSALKLLETGERRKLDVYRLECRSKEAYGINAAAGGFSGQVDEALTPELKSNWGPLAYLIGAVSVIPEITDYDTYLSLDDEPPEVVSALNIVIANGRTVAGGKRISPLSNPEDGLLDVIVVRRGSVVELGDVATRLVAGNLAGSELITHRRAKRVSVESEPGMWFNLDGELLTKEPVEITCVQGALEVVVGENYTAVVEP